MRILIYLFLLSNMSCAKLGYLTEQGVGQLKLQFTGVKNEKILADPKVSEETKNKIRLIIKYKEFFFKYFNLPPDPIYTKTSILETDAVTYLLIASKKTQIKPVMFSFPVVGEFPYIGFFKQDSAIKFAHKLQKNDSYATWIRPVYAYSTLGYFEDRILSSFFQYNDLELAELIFHELFHKIFFIEDEVDLNENLANFFAEQLMPIYFENDSKLKNYQRVQSRKEELSEKVVSLIEVLRGKLGHGEISNEEGDILTKDFTHNVFIPEISKLCVKWNLKGNDCKISQDWNQATYAAWMTYEAEQKFFHELFERKKLNLIDFYQWLNKLYPVYKKQNRKAAKKDKKDFLTYLKENT